MSQQGREVDVGQYRIEREPFYAEVRGEIGLFTIAANSKMPVMLKGPTGCGKTRFVQHMAYRLGRPLITVACHEDLTASDLVGRYLLKGQVMSTSRDGPDVANSSAGNSSLSMRSTAATMNARVDPSADPTVTLVPTSTDASRRNTPSTPLNAMCAARTALPASPGRGPNLYQPTSRTAGTSKAPRESTPTATIGASRMPAPPRVIDTGAALDV